MCQTGVEVILGAVVAILVGIVGWLGYGRLIMQPKVHVSI